MPRSGDQAAEKDVITSNSVKNASSAKLLIGFILGSFFFLTAFFSFAIGLTSLFIENKYPVSESDGVLIKDQLRLSQVSAV